MTKFQKIDALQVDAGEPRGLGIAADRVELRAEAGAAHDELGRRACRAATSRTR